MGPMSAMVRDCTTGQKCHEQAKPFTAATEMNALAITNWTVPQKEGCNRYFDNSVSCEVYRDMREVHQYRCLIVVNFVDSLVPE
jgi:hypothetical protein